MRLQNGQHIGGFQALVAGGEAVHRVHLHQQRRERVAEAIVTREDAQRRSREFAFGGQVDAVGRHRQRLEERVDPRWREAWRGGGRRHRANETSQQSDRLFAAEGVDSGFEFSHEVPPLPVWRSASRRSSDPRAIAA
ncbi:MAG: hypothetical protein CAPSK01_004219 [Candidatus Accumulibacter vicinus]|uniref:Uncharacterized protein n=1 Tax=Candidatus Accumulibacter vicinus TaxID=2954382 RepID=A0A084XV36_9PROT|nr:MAG: hypothetical protein CAPSK01_004219 [Candidatus Accumulibacter vicinus]